MFSIYENMCVERVCVCIPLTLPYVVTRLCLITWVKRIFISIQENVSDKSEDFYEND